MRAPPPSYDLTMAPRPNWEFTTGRLAIDYSAPDGAPLGRANLQINRLSGKWSAVRMEVFFADNSVQKGFRKGQGKLVGFGGIFVADTELRGLSDDVNSIARRYGIPLGVELKWSPPPANWIHANLVDPDRPACYREIMEAVEARGVKALVAVIDLGRVSWTPAKALFQGCHLRLGTRRDAPESPSPYSGLIVADRPSGGSKEEDALLRNSSP